MSLLGIVRKLVYGFLKFFVIGLPSPSRGGQEIIYFKKKWALPIVVVDIKAAFS